MKNHLGFKYINGRCFLCGRLMGKRNGMFCHYCEMRELADYQNKKDDEKKRGK